MDSCRKSLLLATASGLAATGYTETPAAAFDNSAANWTGWRRQISTFAIVLGDQPHLRPETLRTMLEYPAQNPDSICQPEFGGHGWHPVLLPRRAFAELQRTQAKTLKDFLKQTSCPLVKRSIQDPGLALDLDTPEDYKQANCIQAAHEKL